MADQLSPIMRQALEHMKANGNRLVRYPGGFWARHDQRRPRAPYWGTPTVEALVKRGLAVYSLWKSGRNGNFPIECYLTKNGEEVIAEMEIRFEGPDEGPKPPADGGDGEEKEGGETPE